jgi:hypothetical protein
MAPFRIRLTPALTMKCSALEASWVKVKARWIARNVTALFLKLAERQSRGFGFASSASLPSKSKEPLLAALIAGVAKTVS